MWSPLRTPSTRLDPDDTLPHSDAKETEQSVMIKKSTTKYEHESHRILQFQKGGHIKIKDKYVNSLFCRKSFTLECWASADPKSAVNPREMMLFGQHSGGGANQRMHFGIFGHNRVSMRYNYNDLNGMPSNIIASKSLFYRHFAFVYDQSTKTRTIYIDGQLPATDTAKHDLLSDHDFMIGGSPWRFLDDWGGIIRSVRIWNKARSDMDIHRWHTRVFTSITSITTHLMAESIAAIQNCGLLQCHFQDIQFPIGIIYEIVQIAGCGFVACFPMMAEESDVDGNCVIDIVQGIKGTFSSFNDSGNVTWCPPPEDVDVPFTIV